MEQKIETRLLNLSKSLGYMEKPSMADVAKSGADKIITLRTQQAELVKALELVCKKLARGRNVGSDLTSWALDAEDTARQALAKVKGDA